MIRRKLMSGVAAWLLLSLFGHAAAQDAAAPSSDGPAPAADSAPAPDGDASGGSGCWFCEMNVTFGGFVRPEVAVKTSDKENQFNQRGNPYNQVPVGRQAGDPLTGFGPIGANSALIGILKGLPGVGAIVSGLPVVNGTIPITDTVARPIDPSNNLFNLHILRTEEELGVTFTHDLKLIARARMI